MKKLTCFLLFLFACHNPSRNTHPSVLVTVLPYAYLVEQIAGNLVQVEVLVPPGANPHIYEPNPKQVQKMRDVQIWFCLGEPVEEKILKVMKEQDQNLKPVDLTLGITLISSENSTCTPHHLHESQDRHIWMSPKLAQIQAKTIFDALAEKYPQHRGQFQAGFKTLIEKLVKLDETIRIKLKDFEGNTILVSHPAFGYYCNEYGLRQLPIECEGKDPLPRDIARILSEAEKAKVKGVFTQAQYNNKGAILIAQKLALPVYEVDPYSSDYVDNLNHITNLIVQNKHESD